MATMIGSYRGWKGVLQVLPLDWYQETLWLTIKGFIQWDTTITDWLQHPQQLQIQVRTSREQPLQVWSSLKHRAFPVTVPTPRGITQHHGAEPWTEARLVPPRHTGTPWIKPQWEHPGIQSNHQMGACRIHQGHRKVNCRPGICPLQSVIAILPSWNVHLRIVTCEKKAYSRANLHWRPTCHRGHE